MKRITKPFTIPVIDITTSLDWEQLHEFNDTFITRYAKQLSEGKDMRNVFERELSCYETGIAFFEIGAEYFQNGHSLEVLCMIEESSFGVLFDGEELMVDIQHDDESEYINVFLPNGERIQFKPTK